MALKSLLIASLFIAAMAAPTAEAQLGGLGNLLLGLIRILGTLHCTANGSIGVNGTATPVFPNAGVQLQCGGKMISSTTTNGSGVFSILLDPLNLLLNSLLNDCVLRVSAPLASCNASLPSVGNLLSSLQFIGSTLQGPLNIANFIASGFQLLPTN